MRQVLLSDTAYGLAAMPRWITGRIRGIKYLVDRSSAWSENLVRLNPHAGLALRSDRLNVILPGCSRTPGKPKRGVLGVKLQTVIQRKVTEPIFHSSDPSGYVEKPTNNLVSGFNGPSANRNYEPEINQSRLHHIRQVTCLTYDMSKKALKCSTRIYDVRHAQHDATRRTFTEAIKYDK